jgi:hypothetical protein
MCHVLPLLALSLLGFTPPGPAEPPLELWTMTLQDAVRVGFDNCEFARRVEVADGGVDDKSLKIAPTDPEKSAAAFNAEAMDLAHEIEDLYWNVAKRNVELVAAESGLGLAEQALKRENARIEIGKGDADAVAEAQNRVDAYHRNLTAALADVADAERQLRHVLGLPNEGRRIVPTSPPTEAELTPDWQASLAEMNAHDPEIRGGDVGPADAAAERSVEREIALTFLPSLAQSLPPDAASPKADETETAAERVKLIRRKTHDLARYFLEVSANFKQFQTATKQQAEASTELEDLRSDYDRHGIAVGVYLEAVDRWTRAVGQTADFKARYNTSIASFERAKGTLLAHDHITPLPARPSRKTRIQP